MKALMRPIVLTPAPSPVVVLLGGGVATILLSAWLFVAPAFGLPFVDIPHALGGVVSSQPSIAFAVGYVVFFVGGAAIFSLALLAFWSLMPGSEMGVGGAAIKGVMWGFAVWLVTGIALGIASALDRLEEIPRPGLFAMQTGFAGAVWLFAGCLAYGIALAGVAAVEHGITALDALGWTGYYHAATGPTWLGQHRSLDVPQPGARDERS
jgi:hypothetical protein